MLHLAALIGGVHSKLCKRSTQPLEGVIKFRYDHTSQEFSPDEADVASRVCAIRDFLFRVGLIGVYKEGPFNGIGFGNVSRVAHRDGTSKKTTFCITGTQTGCIPVLNPKHNATNVINYNFHEFKLVSRGPAKPSSESLTHAAFYEANVGINAIIHVHSPKWWSRLLELKPEAVPIVPSDVEYGSPEMAEAVAKMVRGGVPLGGLVTAGHTDGIFFYGTSLASTLRLVMETARETFEAYNADVWNDLDDVLKALDA